MQSMCRPRLIVSPGVVRCCSCSFFVCFVCLLHECSSVLHVLLEWSIYSVDKSREYERVKGWEGNIAVSPPRWCCLGLQILLHVFEVLSVLLIVLAHTPSCYLDTIVIYSCYMLLA